MFYAGVIKIKLQTYKYIKTYKISTNREITEKEKYNVEKSKKNNSIKYTTFIYI